MVNELPTGYVLTENAAEIDAVAAHAYLTRSYWAEGIPLETVARSIAGSFCIAVRKDGAQIAFARIISDFATFAYLADVYVLETHQGQGVARAMLAYLVEHPRLQGLRRWALFTRDAQSLYEGFGWARYPWPERMMTCDFVDIYR